MAVQSALDELKIDGKIIDVKTPDDISSLDGIVIPGGESTTIGQLSLGKWFSKSIKRENRKWDACSWNLCWNDNAI